MLAKDTEQPCNGYRSCIESRKQERIDLANGHINEVGIENHGWLDPVFIDTPVLLGSFLVKCLDNEVDECFPFSRWVILKRAHAFLDARGKPVDESVVILPQFEMAPWTAVLKNIADVDEEV
jgi:hypothetical protein